VEGTPAKKGKKKEVSGRGGGQKQGGGGQGKTFEVGGCALKTKTGGKVTKRGDPCDKWGRGIIYKKGVKLPILNMRGVGTVSERKPVGGKGVVGEKNFRI